MVQRTLHSYFHSPRPIRAAGKTTFLHLPSNVRRDIYLLAGLPTESTIYLNYILSSEEDCIQEFDPLYPEQWPTEPNITERSRTLSHFLDGCLPQPQVQLNRHCECIYHTFNADYDIRGFWTYICRCTPLPCQLLYVSKSISDEVSSIFYSENHFSVFQDSLGGFSTLISLPKSALADLRCLSICLNYFEADSAQDCNTNFGPKSWDVECHATCIGSKKQRMFSKAKLHHEQSAIAELQQLCQVLRTHIPPRQLKLSFTCDVNDIEIGEEVTCTLVQLPILRECSIRLGHLYLPDDKTDRIPLQQLAERTVISLTTTPVEKPFNFAGLPPEIQLQILSHTPLKTPYDLIFGPNTAVSKSIRSPFYEPRTFPWRAYPSHAECCTTCSPCPPLSPEPRAKPQICFCWTARAAFSSTCTCFRFPLSLFLLSKSMSRIAEEVFYGQNHFFILPRWHNASRKLEIWNFVSRVPESARRYLRFLTWEMGWSVKDEWGSYLRKEDETYEQWLATLEILKTIAAGQLSLTIDTCFSQSGVYYHNGGWEYGDTGVSVPDSVYLAEADFTFQISATLARDLVEHGIKLRDLFWHFERLRLTAFDRDVGKDVTRELERVDRGQMLEKMVMGQLYEAETRGKGDRRMEWNGYQPDQPPW